MKRLLLPITLCSLFLLSLSLPAFGAIQAEFDCEASPTHGGGNINVSNPSIRNIAKVVKCLNEKFRDIQLETLIVDTGSTIETVKVLRVRDVNIQIVTGPPPAPGETRVRGNIIFGGIKGVRDDSFPPTATGHTLQGNVDQNLIIGRDHTLKYATQNIVAGVRNDLSSANVPNPVQYSSILSGSDHHISASYSNIAGGNRNRIISEYATISGGRGNVIEGYGTGASISGGYHNTASATDASVSGGDYNSARAMSSSITGGRGNVTANNYASVTGGGNNEASGFYSSISGGHNNQTMASHSFVAGGEGNVVTRDGNFSSIVGGANNEVQSLYSVIVGGKDNTARRHATLTGIVDYSAILGGRKNTIRTGKHSVIVGGMDNVVDDITTSTLLPERYAYDNVSKGYHVILGGRANAVRFTSTDIPEDYLNDADQKDKLPPFFNVIVGGGFSRSSRNFSTLLGGYENRVGGNYLEYFYTILGQHGKAGYGCFGDLVLGNMECRQPGWVEVPD